MSKRSAKFTGKFSNAIENALEAELAGTVMSQKRLRMDPFVEVD